MADAPAAPAAPRAHRRFISVAVLIASFMQSLDTTIANVALPRIRGTLAATQDEMSWVLTSYIIAAAIMTPLSGWLAGRFGRRRLLLYSVSGFVIASVACGIAHSIPSMVVARVVQGMCGAALVPMAQAVLLDINTPEELPKAMAMWSLGVVIAPILGPALGGWLTENYNWRWAFFINVPVGLISFLGIFLYMQETPRRQSRFDFFGFSTLSIAIGALQVFLDRGQLEDWFNSTEIWVEGSVSAVAMYFFAVHMFTTRNHPFISPELFKDRNFVSGSLFIFTIGLVLFATLALMPPLLQDLLNYPVTLTGLVLAPRGIGTLVSMLIVSRAIGKIDARLLIGGGFALTALALWNMSDYYLQTNIFSVMWPGILQGFGMGLVYVPLTTLAFGTLPSMLRNEGTTTFSLMRNIGSSIGISAVATLVTRNTQIVHSHLAEHITPYGATFALHAPAPVSAHSLGVLNAGVTAQAAMIAYNDDFKLMLILTLGAIPFILLMRSGTLQKPPASVAIE